MKSFDLNRFTYIAILHFFKFQPEYVEKVDLSKLTISCVIFLIRESPKLIKYFVNRLHEIESKYIIHILNRQPQLIEYFANRINEIPYDDQVEMLLGDSPELAPYFNNTNHG